MNVSLTPELESFVEETVATGRYNSASEVVRAGLRRLSEEEQWIAYAREKVRRGMEDVAAGRVISRKDFLAEIEERHRKRA